MGAGIFFVIALCENKPKAQYELRDIHTGSLNEFKPKAQNEFSDIGFLHSDDDLSIQAFEYSSI